MKTAVVKVLLALNVIVFLAWLPADLYDPADQLGRFMAENFFVSREHLEEGQYWTLLTAEFSHREIWHLALNMMVLMNFGPVLVWRWGQRKFLVFYLIAAMVASIGHVVVGGLIGRDTWALGASGAISGVLAAFAVLYPHHRILLFGIVPLPAYIATILFVGLDVWGVVAQSSGGGLPIGHGAHLGGAAFGLVYSSYQKRRGPREPRFMPVDDEERILYERS
jgi:membrane associated rhomboid family serine protease